jgi:hypothetical protein
VSDKRKTWRKIFAKGETSSKRTSHIESSSDDITYPREHTARLQAVPTDELDLIHYVIGHAILRRDLRYVSIYVYVSILRLVIFLLKIQLATTTIIATVATIMMAIVASTITL